MGRHYFSVIFFHHLLVVLKVINGVVVDFDIICQTSSREERGTVPVNVTAAILAESWGRRAPHAWITYPVAIRTVIGE